MSRNVQILLVLSVAIGSTIGCDAVRTKPVEAAAPITSVVTHELPNHRFLPISPSLPQYALDTETGKLCKTYNVTRDDAQVELCADLLVIYPDHP